MSLEVYGDDGIDGHEDCITTERGEELFIAGAQIMREMLARFVEQGGDHVTAESIRANWVPDWGKDPGKFEGEIPKAPWDA